jgi:hypothetical protein
MTDWPRGWNDYQLIGPEPRTIINANPYLVWRNYNNSAALYTDSIDVEFAQPSPDGVQYITNIPAARWRILPNEVGHQLFQTELLTLSMALTALYVVSLKQTKTLLYHILYIQLQ